LLALPLIKSTLFMLELDIPSSKSPTVTNALLAPTIVATMLSAPILLALSLALAHLVMLVTA